jgi:NAD(P)-dependent dehydrogenase (short-subunit alcohol dehydrogenase family)
MKKNLLLTGATSGIGEELAINLSNNFNLILSGRNIEKLKLVKDKCNIESEIYLLPLDLSNLKSIEPIVSTFLNEQNVTISKFVHCAGFMKMIPLKLVNIEFLAQTFNTNVFSVNILIKLLTSIKNNQSALDSAVFISSNISKRGAKAMSTYGSSKAALDGLMRNLAVELAPKVRVNSVLPGAVLTEMTKEIFANEEVANRMQQQYPLGIGNPNDIFEAVNFLLSSGSRWITGQQITVDGGRSINITG